MDKFKKIEITKGETGWGGPLIIEPDSKKNKIASITGGGIHPLALEIANLSGAQAVDGFKEHVSNDELAAVVIDCGGTARCGVYPKQNIPTINVLPVGASGPLAKYMKPENYVSDVKINNLKVIDNNKENENKSQEKTIIKESNNEKETTNNTEEIKKESIIIKIGKGVGTVVNKFFQAGRDTIDILIRNILPFMAFVATLVGIINTTGIGNLIATALSPLANNIIGLIIISLICAIPIISPLIGPGAVVASVIGVLVGEQIGAGLISPALALPALFAIDAQVGCDFIPVGLSLSEAEASTIDAGVPAVLFERVISGPLSVLIAWVFSFGLY